MRAPQVPTEGSSGLMKNLKIDRSGVERALSRLCELHLVWREKLEPLDRRRINAERTHSGAEMIQRLAEAVTVSQHAVTANGT